MKLRLHNSSIRLRLTRPEVDAIGRGEPVRVVASFPDGHAFTYALRVSGGGAVDAHFNDQGIEVVVPSRVATAWAEGDDVAIAHESAGSAEPFSILIEKDFACLHPRPEDVGAETYPNPNAQ